MSDDRHPVWVLLDKMQMDIRALEAKMNELRVQVAALDLTDQPRAMCPECGITFRRLSLMEEHRYNSHAGPVPSHYVRAERLAGLDDLDG